MAIATPAPRQSKTGLMSSLLLVFLGWLILFSWALSLWVRFNFDQAQSLLSTLSHQQAAAIAEFNDASVASYLTTWLTRLPTDHLANQLGQANQRLQHQLTRVLPDDALTFNPIASDALAVMSHLWQLMRLTTQIMGIKLIILVASLPLFLLATIAGLVDGLNQRAIRRASLGRESSYVFHQLNRLMKRGLLALLMVWLSLPVAITPALLLIPVSLLIAMVVSVTASRFKKYW